MQQNSLLVHTMGEAALKNKVSKGAVAGLVQPEPFVDHNLEATLSHATSAGRYAQPLADRNSFPYQTAGSREDRS